MLPLNWFKVPATLHDSPSVRRLARTVKVDKIHAVGLVVWLWSRTATHFPGGTIQAVDLADLAFQLDGDPDHLAGLVEAGFLEDCGGGSWVVAKWTDGQSVDALERKRERDRQRRASAAPAQRPRDTDDAPDTRGLDADDALTAIPGRLEEKRLEISHGIGRPNSPGLFHQECARLVLDAWPAEKRCSPADLMSALAPSPLDATTARQLVDAAARWVAAYPDRRYLPGLFRWVSSGAWKEDPPVHRNEPAAKPSAPRSASRPTNRRGEAVVTPADLRAIVDAAKAHEAATHEGDEHETF